MRPPLFRTSTPALCFRRPDTAFCRLSTSLSLVIAKKTSFSSSTMGLQRTVQRKGQPRLSLRQTKTLYTGPSWPFPANLKACSKIPDLDPDKPPRPSTGSRSRTDGTSNTETSRINSSRNLNYTLSMPSPSLSKTTVSKVITYL